MRRFALMLAGLVAVAAMAIAGPPKSQQAGGATLDWLGDDAGGYVPRISGPDVQCTSPAMASLYVLSAGDERPKRLDARASADARGNATATVHTPGGATVLITDTWTAEPNGDAFRLDRVVKVISAGTDRAFGSGIEFEAPRGPKRLADVDLFVPGLWWGSDANTPPTSPVHDVGQTDFLFREDRMTAPLVAVRDRRSGAVLTLFHNDPDTGSTITADAENGRVIDQRLQFASLGLRREKDRPLRLAVRFPGTEGEPLPSGQPQRFLERLHPMTAGTVQNYSVTIRLSRAGDFASGMSDVWRFAFARLRPRPVDADLAAVYSASVHVLDFYHDQKDGVAGFPFAVELPAGPARGRNFQIGFVGQQIPCASYLIDEGLRSNNPTLLAKGEAVCEFWAKNCLAPNGVPRTWFDCEPQPHWRDTSTFLRSVTDGISGMLRAWQIEQTAGRSKPEWLTFCRRVADWLLATQNADGSFFREFNYATNKPVTASKSSTLHPVRMLIDLYCVTGERSYRAAAVRAAGYALAHNRTGRDYFGGTPDNPDVLDKEAGWIAMDSYLALYDVTQDKRYLTAAVQAATFTETWIYLWNVQMPQDAAALEIPKLKTTAGAASLIATGHSGADLFMAYASLSYFRLGLYTGDEHFIDVAQLLQANTAQFVDVNGSLGYAQPGLCVEAFTIAVHRGKSVKLWLPWCTSAILEPMSRCHEIFGTIDLADAAKGNRPELLKKNLAFAAKRGFGPEKHADR